MSRAMILLLVAAELLALSLAKPVLVEVTYHSTVGIKLEGPEGFRDRTAQHYLSKPPQFWKDLALTQSKLLEYKTLFRGLYFSEPKRQLPLVSEPLRRFDLSSNATRRDVGGHDYVALNVKFYGVLLGDEESLVDSEPSLGTVGNSWHWDFVLPVHPFGLASRMGWACANEEGAPLDGIDNDNYWVYYDDECKHEDPENRSIADGGTNCHRSQPFPQYDCREAIDRFVGGVRAAVTWKRLLWDDRLADEWRYGNHTTEDSDLASFHPALQDHRLVWKYIGNDSCALAETDMCTGGSGWRRLLYFSSAGMNVGKTPLVAGDVEDSRAFEWHECHGHYHFSFYGKFGYGPVPGRKIGFCLQDTTREWNTEDTPISTPYEGCVDQGISPGWRDDYNAGLDCQWIDVTGVSGTHLLTERLNAWGFMCEGYVHLSKAGEYIEEPTELKDRNGTQIPKLKCTPLKNWDTNNYGNVSVTIPPGSAAAITQPCSHDGFLGSARDCGFVVQYDAVECTSGEEVRLEVHNPNPEVPTVIRICEASKVQGHGLPCRDHVKLAGGVVTDAPTVLRFTCPAARDATEPGGVYSVLVGPAFLSDPVQLLDFVAVESFQNEKA